QRFLEIERDLGVDANMAAELDKFEKELAAGVTRDYVASRGECFNGQIIAKFLDAEFVDPVDCVFIMNNGLVDEKTYEVLCERLSGGGRRYVIPGFYGQGPDGKVKTFSRGGS